jgi:hypothetical protein
VAPESHGRACSPYRKRPSVVTPIRAIRQPVADPRLVSIRRSRPASRGIPRFRGFRGRFRIFFRIVFILVSGVPRFSTPPWWDRSTGSARIPTRDRPNRIPVAGGRRPSL